MFYSRASGPPTACGECVPGSTGQWRVVGAPTDDNVKVWYCPQQMPGVNAPECKGRDATQLPSGYYCGINDYCTGEGRVLIMSVAIC
jgi:hypothetical protein